MTVGILRIELHIPMAHSLKDRRSVIKSLRDQLRNRFNVSVCELDVTEKWQLATLGIATIGDERHHVQGLFQQLNNWLQEARLATLIRVEEEYL